MKITNSKKKFNWPCFVNAFKLSYKLATSNEFKILIKDITSKFKDRLWYILLWVITISVLSSWIFAF